MDQFEFNTINEELEALRQIHASNMLEDGHITDLIIKLKELVDMSKGTAFKCVCGGSANNIGHQPYKGHTVRMWRCDKCEERHIHPEDAQKILKENKNK